MMAEPLRPRKASDGSPDPREGLVYLWQGFAGELSISTHAALATKKIKKVAMGNQHSLFLTSDQEVYSCGRNNHGQLGLGDVDLEDVHDPRIIEQLSDKDIVDIACGLQHSAAVSGSGQLYCWGQASHGQCAVSDVDKVTSPHHTVIIDESKCCEHGIPLAEGHVHIASVSCGAEHTAALSTSGDVWVWGSGIQLGLGEIGLSVVPKKVPGLTEKNVISVCCGDYHTLALVEKSERDGVKVKKKGQIATEIQTQKYFPPLCKKCNKEIYTYTETNDTCIIDTEHQCRDSSEEACQSTTSSMMTTGTDICSSISSCPDSVGGSGGGGTQSSGSQDSISSGPDSATQDGGAGRMGTRSSGSQDSIQSDKEFDVSVETVVEAAPGGCATSNEKDRVNTDASASESKEHSQGDVLDGRTSVKSEKSPTEDREVQSGSVGDSDDQIKSTDCSDGKIVKDSQAHTVGDCQVRSTAVSEAKIVKDSQAKPVGATGGSPLRCLSRERADSENREDFKVTGVSTVCLGPNSPELVSVEDKSEKPIPHSSHDDTCATLEVKQEHFRKEGKSSEIGGQSPEGKEEVIWRRAISLEEERNREEQDGVEEQLRVRRSKSFLDDAEARQYLAKQFEEEEGLSSPAVPERFQLKSTFQNYIPYPSAMMESMKSMTSKAFNNMQTIAESLPFVSGQGQPTEMSAVPGATPIAPPGVEEADAEEVSVHDKVMATSNSSLDFNSSPGHEELQESSFIEIASQDISVVAGDSRESTPLRHAAGGREGDMMTSPKSKSVKTLWAKQDQLEKRLSQDSAKGSDTSLTPIAKVALETEVWSWGHNNKGQLGLGDSVSRSKPCCVKMFSSRCVLKLATGANHSLAMTAVAQIYSWGQNVYGQLGHNENSPTPNRVKFMRGYYVFDIAAGNNHSLFLTDSSGMKPDVFYSGKHPTKDVYSEVNKTLVPTAIQQLKKLGWLRALSSRGDNCACIMSDPAVALPSLYELAAVQRGLYYHLNRIKMDLLKPLCTHAFYTSLDVFPYKSAIQNLLASFYVLTKNVGEQIAELTVLIRDDLRLTDANQFRNYSESIEMTRKYSRFYADFFAIGGFEYFAKNGGSFFEKYQHKFQDLILEKKVDKSLWAANLRKVLLFPIHRLKDFCRLLSKLTDSLAKDSSSHTLLKKAVLNWESLKMTSLNEITVADQTRTFWESSNQKLADSLRIPSRRLLRDSKSCPLSLPSAGRFSYHMLLLFNDIFVHTQGSMTQLFPLETVWVETPHSESDQTGIIVTAPEETLDLVASSSADKAEWLMALNSAINKSLSQQRSSSSRRRGSVERLTPPLIRHAKYTFLKNGVYKDATYNGSWLNGKLHGYGELKWTDGRLYIGMFKHGLHHGHGVLTLPKGYNSMECMEGEWKDGKLNGYGCIRYSNSDCYEGYFKDGVKSGHGTYRQGRHMTNNASIFLGEWQADKRHGYGVQDDILRGEKYMGMWQEDARHGKGVVVTLDGMYFEGTFSQSKLTGFGLMLTEDNSCYEGQFAGVTQLQGGGTLTLPTGDKLEGHFSGSWNQDLKFNGTFIKSSSPPPAERRASHMLGIKSEVYGKLSVPADHKWCDIFRHSCSLLGYKGEGKSNPAKAWESVAVILTSSRKHLKENEKSTPIKIRKQTEGMESLETIPIHDTGNLTLENYHLIVDYLRKAFDTQFHPLGKLMENLVDVFRAAYIGIGAHPRLLHHAIEEIKSYTKRIYSVVRLLFPDLPVNGGPILIFRHNAKEGLPKTTEEAQRYFQQPTQQMEDEAISEIMTAPGLLYPFLLPKIYPPLFDLYALYNDKEDEKYWERILKLNRQGDMALMAYLGIEQKFWLIDEELYHDKNQKLSQLRDFCYASAVDTLQQLSTAFSPIDKLRVLEKTFLDITSTVTSSLHEDHMWCMDDLFPIFQFVVVRAKIRHLGAEIHMIDDLIESHLEYGELGLMSTTLKACYFQIQTEKMPHH